jgi:hypothetical protein
VVLKVPLEGAVKVIEKGVVDGGAQLNVPNIDQSIS